MKNEKWERERKTILLQKKLKNFGQLAIVVEFKQGGFVLGNGSPACVVYVDRDGICKSA